MPAPIPSAVDGFFGYQFHQVAMFCPDGALAAVQHWVDLGYDNWIEDNAVLKGKLLKGKLLVNHSVRYDDVKTEATMLFNYDIMPMELEFLEYRGPSRWSGRGAVYTQPFISHMSVYVDDVIWETRRLREILGKPPFHRFITTNHTNPGVVGKKRFIESIFDTHDLLGYDTKLIQKVDWDYPDEAWLGQEF